MPSLPLTDRQREAVQATGESALVSASAGSGKTTVLAQRCAYLVCDAPQDSRCDVDQLLVLTFTDASAAEMRSRIVAAIRQKADENPSDSRLRDQIARMDTAQISTIHSFCLWIARRWFSQLGTDPLARVMDEKEPVLLKRQILDELLLGLYEGDSAFQTLVDDYGLGDDREIQKMVLRLYDFSESVPNPETWLGESLANVSCHSRRTVAHWCDEMLEEMVLQSQDCRRVVDVLRADDPAGHFYADKISGYADQLDRWTTRLRTDGDRRCVDEASLDQVLEAFEAVRSEVGAFEFDRSQGPRLSKDTPTEMKEARDRASKRFSKLKSDLFGKRLRQRFGLFSVEECLNGLERTKPYMETLTDLVRRFRAAYSARKREMSALDFADLERHAHQLLSDEGSQEPSDIARFLQDRFAYVLVDEFQDINPIQSEIIHYVSRESNPDAVNNLFCVGDIKQSIYGFRLADPTLFAERLRRFRQEDSCGQMIALQDNFRSRPEIIEAVNRVFEHLMVGGRSGVDYDEQAKMRPGVKDSEESKRRSVELHILERKWEPDDSDDGDGEAELPPTDSLDPYRWSVIQREAFLIGTRILEWKAADRSSKKNSDVSFGDIVVLLRAHKVQGERVADVLTRMGIAAVADAGGSLLSTREVRDVLAALEVLDNMRQDIALAAILRSGIFGDRMSADDLGRIRCLDREVAFHEVVGRYAVEGDEEALRTRVHLLMERIGRYREMARRRPLAEVLARLYQQEGYLAYVLGLPGGRGRRANILKLLELARGFDLRHGCGLNRFLSFVKQMEADELKLDVAPTDGGADDVVRIMSIHQSKGLEFPIVFLAGLGNKFNLGDRNGRMIVDRDAGIGLRVVDTEKMIEFPSVAHGRVANVIERSTREEELRILYVAMTRACDKLILVGSAMGVDQLREVVNSHRGEGNPLSALQIAIAKSPLDWLGPVILGSARCVDVDRREKDKQAPLFEAHFHSVGTMGAWRLGRHKSDEAASTRRAVAGLEPLPAHEPVATDARVVDEVVSRLEYVYPHLASTSVRSSLAASEAKRPYDPFEGAQEEQVQLGTAGFSVPPSKYVSSRSDSPAYRGIVTHRVLQHLNFVVAEGEGGLAFELQRLCGEGIIEAGDRELLDEDAIAWFVKTPLAQRIRSAGDGYRREFLFTATEPLAKFEPAVTATDDQVLVRGIVDGILPADDGIEIIDFKTDAIGTDEVNARTEHHRPQMDLYASTMSRIWRRPVRRCWLIFLSPREAVCWECPVDASTT